MLKTLRRSVSLLLTIAGLWLLPDASARELAKLPIADDHHASYYRSHDLSSGSDDIRQAVIIIHGAERNPDVYFDRTLAAAKLSEADESTLILAPGFHTENEVEAGEYFWSSSGWKQGNLAQNGRDATKVSSFDVVDRLITLAADKTRFPRLNLITVIGHSAGGQFVNRYVGGAKCEVPNDVKLQFGVMNPSTFLYLDDRRLGPDGFHSTDEIADKFPNFNTYRYGLDGLNTAMRDVGVETIRQNIATRRCFYFGGVDDTKDEWLDMTPPAMAQGRHRYARFQAYRDYVNTWPDQRWRRNATFTPVEGVGHSSRRMLASTAVRSILFPNASIAINTWSKERLTEAREFSETLDTAAVVILHHGDVVDEWGATALPLKCHSVRKSLLSALYGPHVEAGRIHLSATLGELGIDDNEPSLSTAEKNACIRDLLKARSGVYHPALYETAAMAAARPDRESHAPNTFWYYNNWDFNTAGAVFENLTGRSLFEDFDDRIATPLKLQDFRRSRDTRYVTGKDSVYPAYPFQLSTRDLARFGQLFLNRGRWNDQQLISEQWIAESTASWSDAGASGGYGYMWWVAVDGKHFPGVSLPKGSYSARGYRGQYLVVIPEWSLVVCHRVNSFQKGTAVGKADFGKLLNLILAARPAEDSTSNGHENIRDDRINFDVIIRNGTVIDGTGRDRYKADLGIRDGRIVEIGELTDRTAARAIDANGMVVAPGFIDLHSHADKGLVSDDPARRAAPNLITQGITTVVVNQDGRGPLNLADQRATMEHLGIGLNVCQVIGHGTIRRAVMGDDHERPATAEETSMMQQLIVAANLAGGFGMSAGLEYVPGRWSNTAEMEALSETVAAADGVNIVHERSSGSRPMWFLPSRDSEDQPTMIDNLQELIDIAASTNVRTVATHIKARGTDFWGSSRRMNDLVNSARADGLPVFADQYAYNTSGTDGRIVLIPSWVMSRDEEDSDKSPAELLNVALADESLAKNLRRDIECEITRRGGAENILVLDHPMQQLHGKSLADYASQLGTSAVEAAIALQLDGDPKRRGGARLRAFSMSEKDVEAFAVMPWTATSSDAGIALPEDGPVHPRFYGAFPRKIRHYAIDRGLMSVEESVRVSTSLPASILKLKDRGVIHEGAVADIVVFDPTTIRDKADAFNPHQYAEGIEYVFLNGELACEGQRWIGNLAGRVLKKQPND